MPRFPEVQISVDEGIPYSDKELVRIVDKEVPPIPLFTSDFKSFRLEENKDKLLHEVSIKNNLIVNASSEHEKLNFIENFDKNDFQVAKFGNDPMIESICLEEND